MSWTFNPPPGWPAQPTGWQPPPGWAPDPSWPPPPADWEFWVPVEADDPAVAATSAPAGAGQPDGPAHRPWYQRGWAAGGAAVAVLLVGCLGGAAVAVATGQDQPATPSPESTASAGPQPTPGPPTPVPPGSTLSVGQETSGDGAAVVELDLPDGAVRTITISITGAESYHLNYVDSNGEVLGFIGTGSGDYTGTHLLGAGFATNEPPAALDIVEATGGSWTVQMQDIAHAPVWPQVTSGTGNTVLQIDPNAVAEQVPITGTHDGESNFIVTAYGDAEFSSWLLYNEIGPVSGTATEELGAGATIMEIMADGAWTVRPA